MNDIADTKPRRSLLLLASSGAEADRIAAFCRRAFADVTALHGDWGRDLPVEALSWRGDIVASYCSRWIIPPSVLSAARVAAVNFQPATPSYPGVGGLNWALYEYADSFGVTAHHMKAKPQTGEIFALERFPLLPEDDAESLFHRTHVALEHLACKWLGFLAAGEALPTLDENWGGIRRTREDLQELERIEPGMDRREIARRVRATRFGQWRPYVEIGGTKFFLAE